MKTNVILFLETLILSLALSALGEEANFGFTDPQTPTEAQCFCSSYRLYPKGPIYDLVLSDTGARRSVDALRELVLRVTLTARDGSLSQTFEFDSSLAPEMRPEGPLVWMDDLNLDGYDDLMLCTARGASNVFSIFCLWDPKENRFDPPMIQSPFDPETERWGDPVLLELVNYEIEAEIVTAGRTIRPLLLISNENDGADAHTQRTYLWEDRDRGGRSLSLYSVFDVYDAGKDRVGERMFRFMSQGEKLWDQQYPRAWYDGTRAHQDHREAVDTLLEDRTTILSVAHPSWVHLRERDSNASRSLARVDAGTQVRALKEGCADGWTLVLYDTHEVQDDFFGTKTMLGYIWHSFLE